MSSIFDRKDAKLIKQENGIFNLIYFLKPKRAYSEVYINQKFDVTNLVKYLKNLKKEDNDYTYFHLFLTSIAKLVYQRPYLNRFIMKGKLYQRQNVTISFVAKTSFDDKSEELMTVIPILEDDTLETIKQKTLNKVKKMRSSTKNDTDNFISKIGKLPRIFRIIIMSIIKFLDNHDWLPQNLTKDVIYYSSVLVSNLGSINGGAIYHNLTDFGTNSIVITIGSIHKEYIINEKGKPEIRDICEFGITIDERIADGFYLTKSATILQDYFNNPEVLKEKLYEKHSR